MTGLRPDQLQREGEALERVLARLLAAGVVHPTTAQILRAVRGEAVLDQPHHGRLAAKQRLLTRACVYMSSLAPDPDRWALSELQPLLEGRRGDLLFADVRGRLLLDELKSGACIGLAEARAEDQARELLAAGLQAHGDGFVGVRVVFLTAPRRSYVVTAGARRLALNRLDA